MLTLTPVSLTDCFNKYCRYACSLRLVDTFWDDMILNAEIFRIADGGTPLGYASLYQEESLLTSFFLYENEASRLQEAFSLVQETLSPRGRALSQVMKFFFPLCSTMRCVQSRRRTFST